MEEISPLEIQEDADRIEEIRLQVKGLAAEAVLLARKHGFQDSARSGFFELIILATTRAKPRHPALDRWTLEHFQVALREKSEDTWLDRVLED